MKYPQVTLSEWTQVGEGYNGQAFVSDARLCADQPEHIPGFAAMMAEYGHMLHSTSVEVSPYVPSMKKLLLQALAGSPLVTDAQREQLKALVLDMPDAHSCLHGDFQPGNLILAEGKPYWIDLGWLAQGWFMMDLAHLPVPTRAPTMWRRSTARCFPTRYWTLSARSISTPVTILPC